MKIMQLCFTPVIDCSGGAAKVFCDMANHFCNQYVVLNVCCDNINGRPFFTLDECVKFINLAERNHIKIPGRVKICSELVRLTRYLGLKMELPRDRYYREVVADRLNKVIVQNQPDIVICYDMKSAMILKQLEYPTSKIIVMLHSNAELIMKLVTNDQEQFMKFVKNVQVLLDTDKKYLESRGFSNVVCIGNVVPTMKNDFCYAKEKTIIHVGRLDKKVKRQHLAIEAFAKIAEEFPECQLKLIGGDSAPKNYENELKQIIKDNCLDDRVILMGKSNNVIEEMQKASVFVFPSLYEGFGISLCEAMSVGLPCIGFKNAVGVNTLVQNGVNGILCKDTVEAMSDACRTLMRDDTLRKKLGANGKQFIEQYSEKNIYEKWDKIISG